jgi:hypothetical protein
MNERISAARVALIFLLPALACGGSSDGKGPVTGSGGSVGGGGAGGGISLGGNKDGGANGGSGGGIVIGGNKDGGTTGAGGSIGGGGAAQIKFCNGLSLQGNANLHLSLEVGTPPLMMMADSGTCSTAVGVACKSVPAGMQPVRLLDDTGQEVATGTVMIGDGEQWMMLATLDQTNNQPTVVGGALKAQYTCSGVDPFAAPPAVDGGAMP